MGQPWRYQHPGGLFAIDVPQGWSATDASTSEETIVRFVDDKTNAAMLTNVLTVTRQLDSMSLSDLLRNHLQTSYGNEPTFTQEPPMPQQDGSQLVVWGYNAASADGTTTRLLGNSFIEQRNGLVSLLTVVVPSDQYPRLRPQIDVLLNSYTVRGETRGAASVDELRDVSIGALEPYTDANNLFQINIPVGWTREKTNTEGRALTTWSDPSGNAWLMVQILADDSQRSPQELGLLLSDVITEALGMEAGFALDAPQPQADNTATLSWRYESTANNGLQTPMIGQSIGMQRGEKIAILSISMPESQVAALKPQIEAVTTSFTVNEAAPNP